MISTPQDEDLFYESVFLETKDKVKVHAWWIPVKKAKKTVLFCHGNAGNISYRLETIKIYNQLGINFFIFDYRGYGQSQGSPSEEGTYLDAKAAWDYLVKEKKIKPQNIIIHGRSLGGAVATKLIEGKKAALLIIESSFLSIAAVAKNFSACLPVGWFFGDRYPTYKNLKKVDRPIVIIHSQEDDFIPFKQGEELYKIANFPKEFLILQGNHNEGYLFSIKKYKDFLKKIIKKYAR